MLKNGDLQDMQQKILHFGKKNFMCIEISIKITYYKKCIYRNA